MGDRWSTNGGRLLLDGEHFGAVCNYEAVQLGFTGDHINARAARLMADVLNADPRTNPPKVEMVPWAEVDTRPGKHLPADGFCWTDTRSYREGQRLVAHLNGGEVERYYPGDSVPVRSSDGEA